MIRLPHERPAFEQLDCRVSVVTPENIEFSYALAGPFQRLPAFLFDLAVRCVIFVVVAIGVSFVGAWLPAFGSAWGGVLVLLMFFFFSWFYGIFFETRFNGRTPGKMVFRLRVISTDGRPINGVQATLRNFLRLADMAVPLSAQIFSPDAPPVYAIPTLCVGLITMGVTRRMQRIGDLAAGTMVVSERRRSSAWNLQPEDARAFGLAELIPAPFQPSHSLAQTVALYMENRQRLSPLRRNELAKHLAEPLIQRFGLLPDTGADLLLCAIYVRTFLSEQQQQQGLQRMRHTPPAHAHVQRVSSHIVPPGAALGRGMPAHSGSEMKGASLLEPGRPSGFASTNQQAPPPLPAEMVERETDSGSSGS